MYALITYMKFQPIVHKPWMMCDVLTTFLDCFGGDRFFVIGTLKIAVKAEDRAKSQSQTVTGQWLLVTFVLG